MFCFGRYCLADDRFVEAVKFLDLNDRAGWQLLQVVYHPKYITLKMPYSFSKFYLCSCVTISDSDLLSKSSLLAQKHICFFCFLTIHHILSVLFWNSWSNYLKLGSCMLNFYWYLMFLNFQPFYFGLWALYKKPELLSLINKLYLKT